MDKKRLFNLKKDIDWGHITSFAALFLAGLSLYLQYLSNKAEVTITHDVLVSAPFIDKDSVRKFFGYHRATIVNNGNKSVTLHGIKPYNDSELILSQEVGKDFEKDKISFKIFQIPDTILSKLLFSNEKYLWNFQDHGLEKLSVINKVINPGEAYMLNIGTVYDIFSDTSKHYSTIIFTSHLHFSNGQKLLFGFADVDLHKQ